MLGLIAASIAVISSPTSSVEATEGEAVIGRFAQADTRLSELLPTGELRTLSRNRSEFFAERDGWHYGIAAYRLDADRTPPSLMPILCKVALVRKYLVTLEQELVLQSVDDTLHDGILELAVGETRIRRVERLTEAQLDRWRLYACRVRDTDIQPVDYLARVDGYVARTSYNLAKQFLARGENDMALALLKNTTKDMGVYQNAVAYIVPLVSAVAPDMAQRLDQQRLQLEHIDDPEALVFLGQYRLRQAHPELALQTFERCLTLSSDYAPCLEGRDAAYSASVVRERKRALDYDTFFNK